MQLKLKRVKNSGVDAGILQAYACITVSLSAFIVLAFEPFIFSPWGILGALLWILSQLAAVNGFSMISIAVAAPLVAGITITVAFVWGVAFFGDAVNSMVGCLLGILVIFIGIIGVAASSTTMPDRLWARIQRMRGRPAPTSTIVRQSSDSKGLIAHDSAHDDDDLDDAGNGHHEHPHPAPVALRPINDTAAENDPATENGPGVALHDDDDDDDNGNGAHVHSSGAVAGSGSAAATTAAAAKRQMMLGYVFCIVCALFNGTVMVPSVLFANEVAADVAAGKYPDGAPSGLAYLPSMGIGILIVAVPVHTLYFLARRKRPQFMPRVAALPGMATGVLWAIGNACAIIAGEALGNAIGYPLTQTALLVAQVWSVVYFKEIRGFAIVVLAVSALVLLGGAGMLAVFG